MMTGVANSIPLGSTIGVSVEAEKDCRDESVDWCAKSRLIELSSLRACWKAALFLCSAETSSADAAL